MTAQSPTWPRRGVPGFRADIAGRPCGARAASGEVLIVCGDAARLPLPDGTADLIVTSPPYWQLRSYRDGGVPYPGQVGSEGSPQEYLERLWECTADWKRVLKPSGSLFVVLGDRYSTGNSGDSGLAEASKAAWAGGGHADARAKRRSKPTGGVPPKGLLGLPWRYVLGCTDRLGLILRAEIIWRKKNSLPESVTDRVRREHETILHFTARAALLLGCRRDPPAARPVVPGPVPPRLPRRGQVLPRYAAHAQPGPVHPPSWPTSRIGVGDRRQPPVSP